MARNINELETNTINELMTAFMNENSENMNSGGLVNFGRLMLEINRRQQAIRREAEEQAPTVVAPTVETPPPPPQRQRQRRGHRYEDTPERLCKNRGCPTTLPAGHYGNYCTKCHTAYRRGER